MSSNNYSTNPKDADVVERLRLLTKWKTISKTQLGEVTGIKPERWGNVLTRKVAVRLDEILKVSEVWPMYRHWLIFGEELPESGQISPMTEELASKYLYEAEGRTDDDFLRETILKHVDSLGWLTDLTAGMEGTFINKIQGLTKFYESGNFNSVYKDESDSKLIRLNKIHKQLMKKEPKKKLTVQDVKAIEWLEYLTQAAIKQRAINHDD